MPLILRVEDYARGLDPSINHPSLLRVWLKPFDPALMKKYPVSTSQNRAGFDNIAARIGLGFPSPANTKTESSAMTILNGCLCFGPINCLSKNESAGIRQRRSRSASRNAGCGGTFRHGSWSFFVAIDGFLAQEGISSQRTRSNDRRDEVPFCGTTGLA